MWGKVKGLTMLGGLRPVLEANHFLVGAAMHEVHAPQSCSAQLLDGRAATGIFEKIAVCFKQWFELFADPAVN